MLDLATLLTVAFFAACAGAAIPIGGLLALVATRGPRRLSPDARRAIVAFGGGALLAAVALVLVPHGIRGMGSALVVLLFAGGGVLFLAIDRAIERRGGDFAQLLAMLMDAIPESLALGAAVVLGEGLAPLLAILIGLQNLPEGFNAFGELRKSGRTGAKSALILGGLALATVIAGVVGGFLAETRTLVGGVMIVAAGGITYLLFHDIAPDAHREGHWAATLGAVAGFSLGLGGSVAFGLT